MAGHHDSESFDPTLEQSGSAPGASTPPEDAAAAALRMDLLGASSSGIDVGAAPAPKKLGGQLALLGLVVLAAGGALFAMRYLGMGPRSSQGETVKIDYQLDKAPNFADHAKVLADLSPDRTAEQVPPDQVQRNPFKMEGALTSAEPAQADPSAADRAARSEAERQRKLAEERQRKIDSAFASLELHTVLGGSNPVARISGQTVRPGDTVAEIFKVVEIRGRSVSLECDGKTYVLSLSEEEGAGKPARPRK